MKILTICNQLRVALKHTALALAVGAAVVLGADPSAHASTITYDFASPPAPNMEGWTSEFGNIWDNNDYYNWIADNGHLGIIDDWLEAAELAHSPAFTLDGSGNLTCKMIGHSSTNPAPPLHSADIGPLSIVGGPGDGAFIGVALRDILTDTYVLWKAHPGSNFNITPPYTDLVFTQAELASYANNGRTYTLDFIDNDKGAPDPRPEGSTGKWGILGSATIPGALAVLRTESQMLTFGSDGVIDQFSQTVTITVPAGTNLATYAPTFTLSPGATCVPASGAIPSPKFSTTNPMTYTVTSEDTSTTTSYLVTVNVAPFIFTYDFQDGTLQGWHNRVWDATGAAWVDLAPNVQTMPNTVNGGIIQPPSGDNNLFGNTGTQVDPIGGNTDYHLNTLWLRSPIFKLAAGGNLTTQMSRGMAHGSAPANDA